MYTIKNEFLTICVKEHGAELCSIMKNGVEYLWQADPNFWARHSPVLFPIVGSLWEGCYKVDGKSFSLSQHGFARDMDFTLVTKEEDKIVFKLVSNDYTRERYPWDFSLEIGYKLVENTVEVSWNVHNLSENHNMYFQIGAHPAFNYPSYESDKQERGYFSFEPSEGLQCIRLKEKACVDTETKYPLELNSEGLYPLDKNTFDVIDTLMLEDYQLKRVTLHTPNKTKWLSLSFDAPVVGLWSPPKKNAPFICIEPWYGRCDRIGFTGEFKDRDWVNELKPLEEFKTSYKIEICL